jgi:hypothetical protein
MGSRTPPEKKALSLKKDRRNAYGESQHGARKAIPLRKKMRNRANRHQQESALPTGPVQLDEDDADRMESAMHLRASKRWNKVPDASLDTVIDSKLERRVRSRGLRIRSKALRAFVHGLFSGQCPGCRSDVYILVGRNGAERYGAFCAVGEGKPAPTFLKAAIRGCAPSELPEFASELYLLCVETEDSPLGECLRRLFGVSKCPRCLGLLDVASVVDAGEGIRSIHSKAQLAVVAWPLSMVHWIYYRP